MKQLVGFLHSFLARPNPSSARSLLSLDSFRLRAGRYYQVEPWPLSAPPQDRLSVRQNVEQVVGVFWDLDNKPPNNFPPYDAAVRLKLAASSFGAVRYTFAYANPHAFSYVPPIVQQQRRERQNLNRLEAQGMVKPFGPHICRVCGRKFYTNLKLVHHFKQIHEREQQKRLNRLESARGNRRVRLAAAMSMKMHKYKTAARDLLTPRVGYGLGDELGRAGFRVRTVADKPEAADAALRREMVALMDRRQVGCVVLVSDDLDFVGVLREAGERGVKTVVVGDDSGGALRRCADSGFLWREIVSGKAKKEATTVVGRWKDREILRRLEWTHMPEEAAAAEDEEGGLEENGSSEGEEDGGQWWELDSDEDQSSDLSKNCSALSSVEVKN